MHISLLYQHLIIYSIICISGITGEFFTLSGIAIAAGIAYFSPSIINSKFLNGFGGGEACTDKFIQSSNVRVLEEQLKQHVHGQELAISHICGALKNHFQNRYHNTKALAISLHGLPGTGKNYVTDFIVSSIFKRYKDKGTSRFVHKFNSRIHFPNENHVSLYRLQLTNWIISNVTACDRAIFIFDEVDKFPKGLLDVIIPFIDHHAVYNQISFQNTIFLFLSNSGGTEIMNTFLELRKSGERYITIHG
ncbi:torsin-1A-like, partial [Diaphorina citri]|uniref:Torsin-1A-like n=1 Tax=Diaphorina citri TaxID=121845 RepID=A0A1S3DRI1_DIACI